MINYSSRAHLILVMHEDVLVFEQWLGELPHLLERHTLQELHRSQRSYVNSVPIYSYEKQMMSNRN